MLKHPHEMARRTPPDTIRRYLQGVEVREGLYAVDECSDECRSVVDERETQGHVPWEDIVSLFQGQRNTQRYFTLVTRYVPMCAGSVMRVKFAKSFIVHTEAKWPRVRDSSIRSHIHGINRNRIALHIILNGRRNCARW